MRSYRVLRNMGDVLAEAQMKAGVKTDDCLSWRDKWRSVLNQGCVGAGICDRHLEELAGLCAAATISIMKTAEES